MFLRLRMVPPVAPSVCRNRFAICTPVSALRQDSSHCGIHARMSARLRFFGRNDTRITVAPSTKSGFALKPPGNLTGFLLSPTRRAGPHVRLPAAGASASAVFLR